VPPGGERGKPVLEGLRGLGYDLLKEFACFSCIILDDTFTFWAVRSGNDLLAPPYTVLNPEN